MAYQRYNLDRKVLTAESEPIEADHALRANIAETLPVSLISE